MYRDALAARNEFHHQSPIAKGTLDQLVLDDFRVRSREIKAHTAVLGFHAR